MTTHRGGCHCGNVRCCGIRSFARGVGPGGKEMIAVNVRCLEDFEPSELTIKDFDGASR